MRHLLCHLTVIAATLAACGEQPPRTVPEPAPAPPATAAERRQLRQAEDRIVRHCVAVTRSIVDPEAAPAPAEQARAFAAADRLVATVRANPRADLGAGQDMRLFLADVIENLEGSNCDPRMIDRLERGLATVPPG